MGDVTLLQRSSLAVAKENIALSGTVSSTGTAVTGSSTFFTTELVVGSIIGTATSGYRTVTVITSAIALTVDAAWSPDLAASTVLLRGYGSKTPFSGADLIECLDDVSTPFYKPEMKERNVIRNTFSAQPDVIGAEMDVTGSIPIELHGSGTAGTAPESDVLWECAFGTKTVVGATSVTYGLSKSELPSFHGKFWQGGIFRRDFPGNKVSKLTLEFSTGELIKPKFEFMGQKTIAATDSRWVALTPYALGAIVVPTVPNGYFYKVTTPGTSAATEPTWPTTGTVVDATVTFTTQAASFDPAGAYPLVASNMTFTIGGVSYPVSKCSIELENVLYKDTAVTTSGISRIIRTGRKVTGSFELLFEDLTVENAFRNMTEGVLNLVAGSTGGNILTVNCPKIRHVEAPVSTDNGLYKYSVKFKCFQSASTGDDEITAMFT